MNFVYTKSEQVQIQLKSIFLVAPKLNSRYYRKLGKAFIIYHMQLHLHTFYCYLLLVVFFHRFISLTKSTFLKIKALFCKPFPSKMYLLCTKHYVEKQMLIKCCLSSRRAWKSTSRYLLWVQPFLSAAFSFRASIEEKYAKDLLGLSKKVCGHNEMK